jgi:recombinational DNA repair protein RecT
MRELLVEKFKGVVSVLREIEIEGEILLGLDTLESEPVDTYEQAVEFINSQEKVEGFHEGEVKKVRVKA